MNEEEDENTKSYFNSKKNAVQAKRARDKLRSLASVPPEHYLTHVPSHPLCDTCNTAKAVQFPAKRRNENKRQRAKRYAESVSIDTAGPIKEAYDRSHYLFVTQDDATTTLQIQRPVK